MLELLLAVVILGIVAYAVTQFPMPHPFQVIVYCILLIILVVVLFRALGTSNLGVLN